MKTDDTESNGESAVQAESDSLEHLARPAFISICGLLFGKGFAPTMPDGWELHESEDDWMKATDSRGQNYFLSKETAYPERIAGAGMMVEDGKTYIDLDNGVPLSDLTITEHD
jgi:hypothetical protein